MAPGSYGAFSTIEEEPRGNVPFVRIERTQRAGSLGPFTANEEEAPGSSVAVHDEPTQRAGSLGPFTANGEEAPGSFARFTTNGRNERRASDRLPRTKRKLQGASRGSRRTTGSSREPRLRTCAAIGQSEGGGSAECRARTALFPSRTARPLRALLWA